MATNDNNRTEILVNIAAPSGVKDDAKYRRQVAAILDFEAATRVCVYPISNSGDEEQSQLEDGRSNRADVRLPSAVDAPESGSSSSATQTHTTHAPLALPMAFGEFSMDKVIGSRKRKHSDLENAISPHKRLHMLPSASAASLVDLRRPSTAPIPYSVPRRSPIRRTQSDSESLETPPSVVPDSQPLQQLLQGRSSSSKSGGLSCETGRTDNILSSGSGANEHASGLATAKNLEDRISSTSDIGDICNSHDPKKADKGFLRNVRTDINTIYAQNSSHNLPVSSANAGYRDVYSHRESTTHIQLVSSPTALHRASSPPPAQFGAAASDSIAGPIHPSQLSTEFIPSQNSIHSPSALPLEIHPPPPPASSTLSFTTHITPTLDMLAKKLDIAKRFKPTMKTRDLRPLERGYWSIRLEIMPSDTVTVDSNLNERPQIIANKSAPTKSTAIWTHAQFLGFWKFLADFIQEGRAGWGVWVVRESPQQQQKAERGSTPPSTAETASTSNPSVPATSSASCPRQPPSSDSRKAAENEASIKDHDSSDNRTMVEIRIYCWGELVPYIWALMFLASERRIKGIGTSWKDGAGEDVVRMP